MKKKSKVVKLPAINYDCRKIAVAAFGVDYTLTPALTITPAYYLTKSTGRPQVAATKDGKMEQLYLIGKYAMSKRTTLYSTYTHAKAGSIAATDTELAPGFMSTAVAKSRANRFTLGMVHTF